MKITKTQRDVLRAMVGRSKIDYYDALKFGANPQTMKKLVNSGLCVVSVTPSGKTWSVTELGRTVAADNVGAF